MSDFIKLIEQALSPEFCDELIQQFEDDQHVQPDPQPSYSTRHYLNISMQRSWFATTNKIVTIANALVDDFFSGLGNLKNETHIATHDEWSDDGYILARYNPGDACIMHVDGQSSEYPNNGLRLVTLLFYLNNVSSGGETFFPLQNRKIAPKKGQAIIFPVGFTHSHEVIRTNDQRYILQTWITDPNLLVFHRDEFDEENPSGP